MPKIIDKILHPITPDSEPDHSNPPITHSKILNLGKYIYEFQTHKVKPEFQDRYEQLVTGRFAGLLNNFHYGSWRTIVGHLDHYLHVMRYADYSEMAVHQQSRLSSKQWLAFQRELSLLLYSRSSEVGLEFSFLASDNPRKYSDGIYEMRSYRLKPGHLLEWGMNWREGMECRKKFSAPVGAWFSQIGTLHRVHHIWAFKDLADRKVSREAAWVENGWSKTVARTVPLVQKMESSVLQLLPVTPTPAPSKDA